MKKEEKQGWLTPDGKIIPVFSEGHAKTILKEAKRLGIHIDGDIRFKFIEMGYILFCESCIITLKEMTVAQIVKIEEYMQKPIDFENIYLYEDLINNKNNSR